jgi:hypothetical protein
VAAASRSGWPLAAALVAVVAIVAASGLYVYRSLRALPGEAVDKGREVLRDLGDLAAAFRQGDIEIRFLSYATTVAGSTYLQFATVRQTEVFRRTDRASTLWGTLDLPEVIVEATAPVSTSYFLDLEGEWRFVKEGGTVRVEAPAPRFNEPAVDASEIHYEVRQGSLLRDSEAALSRLKAAVTAMARQRARENLELVREMGRRKTEDFVRAWLLEAFGDGGEYRVVVTFADEGPALRTGEAPLEPARE